ncbi:hypothetical protein D9758_000692 [Tetrapyrgos nigripes]|uniref:Cytidyltransferase-like domain-containing protein n=1 Tax=Tetrapyrgos nigripes TaxID=182062 RepID=A0A8H5GYR7_9AGAR|nr:hypothetical protein D9758_000692 [Tetrapyrgos nigripes]
MNKAVLLANLKPSHTLLTPHYLAPAICTAANNANNHLVIVLFSQLFASDGVSHTTSWDDVQRLLTYVYVQATKTAQDKGNMLMNIDVLLKGLDDVLSDEISQDTDVVYRVSGGNRTTLGPVPILTAFPDIIAARLPESILTITQTYIDLIVSLPDPDLPTPPSTADQSPSTFPVVAVGGTFDHLHAGHKILLSMGAWIANTKLIVGVTDTSLLSSKAYAAYLESIDVRIANVRYFLSLFKPGITYDIVPINDVYGPTGWDPNVQALVVSHETLKGAEAIATHRASKSFPPLRTFVIDVISQTSEKLDHEDVELMRQTKMGSTFIREWIAKQDKEKKNEA